ncbi:hypothetical protein BDR26DRAFT_915190 [Obelidium mucronatum]|nr:hypothetical protein BDR26DRAFT_915190 [Obelidium mucronatum]
MACSKHRRDGRPTNSSVPTPAVPPVSTRQLVSFADTTANLMHSRTCKLCSFRNVAVLESKQSALISSDAKYLFISTPHDDGPPRLHSQFLNLPFLVVAQSILERVVSICNFGELSETCGFMFYCAAMTHHILKRVALDKTGNFNKGCSSAVTYGKNADIMVSSKYEEVEEERFDSDPE